RKDRDQVSWAGSDPAAQRSAGRHRIHSESRGRGNVHHGPASPGRAIERATGERACDRTACTMTLVRLEYASNVMGNPQSKVKNITFWVPQVLTAAAFLMAGFAKLSGQPMMVETFDK